MKRTAVGAGLLVVLVAIAALAAGGGTAAAQPDNGTEDDVPLGAEISSFMQASSAEAEGEVDDGMFQAAMQRANDSEERRALIEQRQQRLQERQARLQERRARISGGDDEFHPRDYALATHVEVGADRLERSAAGTQRAAEQAGVDTAALDEIRRNASELRGHEVAELVSRVVGPPADARGQGNANGTDGRTPGSNGGLFDDERGNASEGSEGSERSGNGSDRPENGSENRGNGTDGSDRGQSGERGQGDGGDVDSAESDEAESDE